MVRSLSSSESEDEGCVNFFSKLDAYENKVTKRLKNIIHSQQNPLEKVQNREAAMMDSKLLEEKAFSYQLEIKRELFHLLTTRQIVYEHKINKMKRDNYRRQAS